MSRTQKLKELVAASLILKTLNDNPYDRRFVGVQYLCKKDKHFAKAYSLIGPITYQVHEGGYAFMVHEIIEQMLCKKIGTVIYGRLVDMCGGSVTPESIDKLTDEQIMSIGTSNSKVKYIRSLTEEVISGRLVFSELESLSDADVMKRLMAIRGIVKWTAKMYLIFCLDRQDILPIEDVAFLQGYAWPYNTKKIDKASVEKNCKKWSPYSSIATRYMYRVLDGGYTKI